MPISRALNQDILSFFRKIEDKNTTYINQLIVSSFVISHGLEVREGNILNNYILPQDEKVLLGLVNLIKRSNSFDTEALVEIFEYVISPADKEVNGAVYTPAYIRESIIAQILSRYKKARWKKLLYADLSCGCGGFFYTLIKNLKASIPHLSVRQFVRENIIGVDIKEFSIERTKLLLALYALQEGEMISENDFNLYCQNSLSNQFVELPIVLEHGGIDVVMGNPPYVASAKLSEENRGYYQNWEVSRTGKADLYLPFFQLGIDCLTYGGMLGYITVNTFYRSLNGSAFRAYLSRNGYDMTIVDFGSEQLFRGCSTYTCVCLIEKRNTGLIHYIEKNSERLSDINNKDFETIDYKELNDKKGWILKDKYTSDRIRTIEKVGKPLGDVVRIKNGLATLRNDIYVIKPNRQDTRYFYFEKEGQVFKVEMAICRKVVKANLLRTEEDIDLLIEYIIFPYYSQNGKVYIMEDEVFQKNYPCAYSYLKGKQKELAKRDKGHKKYPKWYAFGRSQALNINGERLLFPHICDNACFVYCEDDTLLYYDGYAIFAKDHRQLVIIKKILKSDVFWYYITKTSKPYSGGYFSLEKRYIMHFGIPELTQIQEDELIALENQAQVNEWLKPFYHNVLSI